MTDFLLNRRSLLIGAGSALLAGSRAFADSAPSGVAQAAFLDELEQRTFNYFWETTPANGLTPDRWPSESFCSIAAVGFALTAYIIGAERGWVSRASARDRVLTTLKFFRDAPQGEGRSGFAGYKGFFYHFLDSRTGTRFKDTELSTVDTALLIAGMLACQSYFDAATPEETKLRDLVDEIYGRVDWAWAMVRKPFISHGWHPETGHIKWDWRAYDEAHFVYLIALGSPTRALGRDSYDAWASGLPEAWGSEWGQTFVRFPPLFGHQFTQCWFDLRGMADTFMAGKGIDYFENSRRATLAQRTYATVNPNGWRDYGPDCWGITASDGPADVTRVVDGKKREFHSYAGRGVGGNVWDDGTLAPYGAGSSIVFTPKESISALMYMREKFGNHLYGRYGFVDSFNTTFRLEDVKLDKGKVVPDLGWFDTDHIGIDQGPLVAMLANHRDQTVWRATRRNAHIKRALLKAGFKGGWL
ncbi:glucoamylase family protein [Paucibacter sp. R3-3]|uniref:Glucoamylase family protein n=1 Tax=Roseateles agri TaxID=3098619 RepID=A0ABU5DIX6_9BURK|nr:glucoamylase family protein [Paucibacter sp. R3-3]MDY0746263.1 glucoamylase family protein [Paucibacter sp. R3-3]